MHLVGTTNAQLRSIGYPAASLQYVFGRTDSGAEVSPFPSYPTFFGDARDRHAAVGNMLDEAYAKRGEWREKITGDRTVYGENHDEPDGVNSLQQGAVRQKLAPDEFSEKTKYYVMSEVFRGIKIKTPDGSEVSKKFSSQVHKALSRICETEDGCGLLGAIRENFQATGNEIFISPTFSTKEKYGIFGLLKTRKYRIKKSNWTGEEKIGTYNKNYTLDEESAYNTSLSGKGAHAFIEWDPQNSVPGDEGSIPPVTLAHELIHAERKQSGNSVAYRHMHDAYRGTTRADNHRLDENMTVGLVSGYPYNENNIRAQMGLKRRQYYFWAKPSANSEAAHIGAGTSVATR